jgi:hypothetical protein
MVIFHSCVSLPEGKFHFFFFEFFRFLDLFYSDDVKVMKGVNPILNGREYFCVRKIFLFAKVGMIWVGVTSNGPWIQHFTGLNPICELHKKYPSKR